MVRPPRRPRSTLPAALCAITLALSAWGGREAEAANWRDLTGRVAPDLTFTEATNGIAPGTRLADYRNQSVVLLVFWLRDCPHCARELPKVQEAHEVWGRSGLQVVTVVHGFPLAEVLPAMQARGWTFPVARDPTGEMASLYGGGRRPGYFVIGIDGRVKASNAMPSAVIESELGRWRLNELGPVPEALTEARNLVYQGDYGSALRLAEAAGAVPTAGPDVKAAVARLAQIAERKLQNRVDRAEAWYRRGGAQQAAEEYRGMVATFQGTSLEARARALHDAFMARLAR